MSPWYNDTRDFISPNYHDCGFRSRCDHGVPHEWSEGKCGEDHPAICLAMKVVKKCVPIIVKWENNDSNETGVD